MKKLAFALSLATTTLFAQYNITTYDSIITDLGNAVSLEGVEQVVQDSNGVYWFASGYHGYNGLIAFDGQKWYEYSQNSIPPIGYKVNAIGIDSEGELWAGGEKMVHFDGIEWRTYNVNKSLTIDGSIGFTHHWATDIDFDSEGTCYVSSEGVGGFSIIDEEFNWIRHKGYETYRANSDIEVVRDTVYMINRWAKSRSFKKVVDGYRTSVRSINYSKSGSADKIDSVELKPVIDMKSNPATESLVLVQQIDSTTIEIIEQRGDYWIHRNFYTVEEFNKIELTETGDVWVLADGYLQSKREAHTAYIVPDQTPGLKGEIENFFLSSKGVLWITTKESGLTRVAKDETSLISHAHGVQQSKVLTGINESKLSLHIAKEGDYKVEILSVQGQVVGTLHDGLLKEGAVTLSHHHKLGSGMYLLQVTGAVTQSEKIFIQ